MHVKTLLIVPLQNSTEGRRVVVTVVVANCPAALPAPAAPSRADTTQNPTSHEELPNIWFLFGCH